MPLEKLTITNVDNNESFEVLFNPKDSTHYTLIFDTRTWTPIQPSPVHRFRGFTYKVPPIPSSTPGPTDNSS